MEVTPPMGMIAGVIGVVGSIGFVIGLFVDPRQALTSYLFAYTTVLTVVLGALLQVMMSYLTGANWFRTLRRLTLPVLAAMPVLCLLAVPVLAGASVIYPWHHPELLSPTARELVDKKQSWLNLPFFIGRSILYLAVFAAVSWRVRKWSLIQSLDRDVAGRLRRVSAGGLVAVSLTMTFAAFDWLMSLDPAWYSTIYGVYVFAGGIVCALGIVAIAGFLSSTVAAAKLRVTSEEYVALGKLMLAFVMFWGYIAFSQYFIIWIADIPSDAAWYVIRAKGSWGILALVVAAGQFAIPFLLLLSHPLKRHAGILAGLGLWLIAMHILDMYWLVLPTIHPAGIHVSWLDGAALAMVGGLVVAGTFWLEARSARPMSMVEM